MSTGQVTWLGPAGVRVRARRITIRANRALRLALAAGRPTGGPFFACGPSVMHSLEQILEAFHDHQAGRLALPVTIGS